MGFGVTNEELRKYNGQIYEAINKFAHFDTGDNAFKVYESQINCADVDPMIIT